MDHGDRIVVHVSGPAVAHHELFAMFARWRLLLWSSTVDARRGIRIRPPETLFKREEAVFAEAIDSLLGLNVRVRPDRLKLLQGIRNAVKHIPFFFLGVPSRAVCFGEIFVAILDVEIYLFLIGFTRAFIIRIE